MKIENNKQAYRLILENLNKEGYRWRELIDINRNRYRLIFGKENHPNIFIMFKRDVFRNFGREFRHKGHTGVGDTINCRDLRKCLVANVKWIYTTFPNGNTYCIGLTDFLANSIKWSNKEGKDVRSISIHKYKRTTFKEWKNGKKKDNS